MVSLSILEKPLAEFQDCLEAVEDNELAFYLALGWVELAPSDRVAHLQGLLDYFVTVEILSLDVFASDLYSFDVTGLDRYGSSPDESCQTRKEILSCLRLL